MVVEISTSGGIEPKPGCIDDRAGCLYYVDGWERKCTRIRYQVAGGAWGQGIQASCRILERTCWKKQWIWLPA